MFISQDILLEILSFLKAGKLNSLKLINSKFHLFIQSFFDRKPKYCIKHCKIHIKEDSYTIKFNDVFFETGTLPAIRLTRDWPKNLLFKRQKLFSCIFSPMDKTKNQIGNEWIQNALKFLTGIKDLWFHGLLIIEWECLVFTTEDFNCILKELCSDVLAVAFYSPIKNIPINDLIDISTVDYNNISNMDHDLIIDFLHKGYVDDFFSIELRRIFFHFFDFTRVDLNPFELLSKKLQKRFTEDTKKVYYYFRLKQLTDDLESIGSRLFFEKLQNLAIMMTNKELNQDYFKSYFAGSYTIERNDHYE